MNSIRHTREQLLVVSSIGYVDCNAKFRSDTYLLPLEATFSGDIHASPRNNQNHKLTVTTILFCPQTANTTLATLWRTHLPQYIQQCLNLMIHFSLRHLAAKILSQLYNNFISFPYFFPSYETCSINANPLFHAAIKNLHIKTFRHLGTSLLYIPCKLSEETTQRNHTHTRTLQHIHAKK